jgi:hypothetical protein
MGIDRIGRGAPAAAPPSETAHACATTEPGRPFEVPPAGTAPGLAPETAAVAAPKTAVDRWRAGEIDIQGYVEAKVEEATGHLGTLPTADLEAIRAALRDRMASDPTLLDLVRTVTGRAPDPPREE